MSDHRVNFHQEDLLGVVVCTHGMTCSMTMHGNDNDCHFSYSGDYDDDNDTYSLRLII
jgi:hypothetical protein